MHSVTPCHLGECVKDLATKRIAAPLGLEQKARGDTEVCKVAIEQPGATPPDTNRE